MKRLILTLCCLFAVPAFAGPDEVLLPVRAKVLSVKRVNNGHEELQLVRVKLQSCGAERCSGVISLAMPAKGQQMRRSSEIVIHLTRPTVQRLPQFKRGGSMERLALATDVPAVDNAATAGSR